jgi:zinc transport system permease protein
MMEFLSLDFAQRALLVGTMAAMVAGALSSFVVASRQSVFSDMLAHTALAGVGIGVFFGFSPIGGALAVTLASAVFLWAFLRRRRVAPESVTMVLLSGGLAIALLFSHLARDTAFSLETFLFGSILTIRPEEVPWFLGLSLIVLAFLGVFFRRIMTVAMDGRYAENRFPNSSPIELGFFLCVGVLVGMSLTVIGGLLVGALLVIPAVSAQLACRSFISSVLWSIGFNVLAVFVGIVASFFLDIPASSAIVLTLIAQLGCTALIQKMAQKSIFRTV